MSSVIQTTNRNNVIREDENMRTISTDEIIKNIKEMCIEANYYLSDDMKQKIDHACQMEESPLGRQILSQLEENMQIAEDNQIPICQDTGMAVVFLKIGQDVHIEGMNLEDAVNEGIRQGYVEGYLRKSVVGDPLLRKNTEDNTPGIIHYEIVPGENIEITVAPKGFGSENMSRLTMLKPADGVQGVKDFVMETVKQAGANPCPPIVLGIGIGGSFDKCAALAKKALLRPLDQPNADPYYAALEKELLDAINATGFGPQGFGGATTCLGVCIEQLPTHVACLPVAVNVSCHVTRRASAEV